MCACQQRLITTHGRWGRRLLAITTALLYCVSVSKKSKQSPECRVWQGHGTAHPRQHSFPAWYSLPVERDRAKTSIHRCFEGWCLPLIFHLQHQRGLEAKMCLQLSQVGKSSVHSWIAGWMEASRLLLTTYKLLSILTKLFLSFQSTAPKLWSLVWLCAYRTS